MRATLKTHGERLWWAQIDCTARPRRSQHDEGGVLISVHTLIITSQKSRHGQGGILVISAHANNHLSKKRQGQGGVLSISAYTNNYLSKIAAGSRWRSQYKCTH
jgi:hypothetical protein